MYSSYATTDFRIAAEVNVGARQIRNVDGARKEKGQRGGGKSVKTRETGRSVVHVYKTQSRNEDVIGGAEMRVCYQHRHHLGRSASICRNGVSLLASSRCLRYHGK